MQLGGTLIVSAYFICAFERERRKKKGWGEIGGVGGNKRLSI